MHYSLDEIETFLTVMELGTVTAAAARLNLSKSVVSKRIADLETGLGVALFRRNAGRIAPTEAAQRLTERMRPALSELRAAAESAAWAGVGQEVLRGTLTLSLPMSFGTLHLGPILARFAARHPELQLRLDYDDRNRDLAREGFDLAIRVGQSPALALMSKRLCDDRAIACAAPEFLARHGTPQHPADLNGAPLMGYSHIPNTELWHFLVDGQPFTPVVAERVIANNGEAMRDFAEAGLGFAMLPGFIGQPAIDAGRLVPVLEAFPTRSLPVMAVWPPVQPKPAKLARIIEYLEEELKGGAPWREKAKPPV